MEKMNLDVYGGEMMILLEMGFMNASRNY